MRRLNAKTTAVLLLLVPFAAGGFMLQGRSGPVASARLFDQVFTLVSRDAVDSLSTRELYERAARGLVEQLDDAYASLYSPDELATFSRETLGGAYGGLGMQVEDQQGQFTVSRVFPDTPAEAGGVREGDRVIAVDGAAVRGWTLEQVTQALTGKPGTRVAATLRRAGVADPIRATFTRAIVHVPAVPFTTMLDGRVGYVPLQRFSESSSEEMERALRRLASSGVQGIILDLRGNGGGSVDQSLFISNFFLKKGQQIATVRYRGQPPVVYSATRAPLLDTMPLVVLTDGSAASAAEIVAGSLQDHDRALIVGTTSYGKGLVQTLYPLEGGWALKLTTGKWYTPSGRSIQKDATQLDNGRLVDFEPDSLETDLVKENRPVFRSDAGRVVYGGGAITPDVIVPTDTISTAEQAFLKAIGSKSQLLYVAIYDLALELKGRVSADFEIEPAWREELFRRIQAAGVPATRAQFDAATPLIDRMLSSRIARLAFGDAGALRRSVPGDPQLTKALELLRRGRTQRELFAVAGVDIRG